MESCRWFKNMRFGRQLTNLPPPSPVRRTFFSNIKDLSFDSTSPIIEEVHSEEEEGDDLQKSINELLNSTRKKSLTSPPSSSARLSISSSPARPSQSSSTSRPSQLSSSVRTSRLSSPARASRLSSVARTSRLTSSAQPSPSSSPARTSPSSSPIRSSPSSSPAQPSPPTSPAQPSPSSSSTRSSQSPSSSAVLPSPTQTSPSSSPARASRSSLALPSRLSSSVRRSLSVLSAGQSLLSPSARPSLSSSSARLPLSKSSARSSPPSARPSPSSSPFLPPPSPSLQSPSTSLRSPTPPTRPLPSPVQEAPGPLRRSRRTHRKPLDFARGQRLVYNLRGDLVAELPGFPEKYDYGRRPRPEIPPASMKPAMRGDYWFKVKTEEDVVCGELFFKPMGHKLPSKTSAFSTSLFIITKGKVLFRVGEENHILEAKSPDDSIILRNTHQYSIRNNGPTSAYIKFFVCEQV